MYEAPLGQVALRMEPLVKYLAFSTLEQIEEGTCRCWGT